MRTITTRAAPAAPSARTVAWRPAILAAAAMLSLAATAPATSASHVLDDAGDLPGGVDTSRGRGINASGQIIARGTKNGLSSFFPPAPKALATDAAVPEPASWALTIVGFGMMGVSLRRRTRDAFA